MDRMSRAYRVDESIDLTAALLPHLLAEREIAVDGVVVVQLIAPPVPCLPAELSGAGDHGLDQLLCDPALITRHVLNRRTESLHRPALLSAEGVREHSVQTVAFGGADHRERDAGGPSGVLDDRVPD